MHDVNAEGGAPRPSTDPPWPKPDEPTLPNRNVTLFSALQCSKIMLEMFACNGFTSKVLGYNPIDKNTACALKEALVKIAV